LKGIRRIPWLIGAAFGDVLRPSKRSPRTPHQELAGRLLAVAFVSLLLDVGGTCVAGFGHLGWGPGLCVVDIRAAHRRDRGHVQP